jgi:basic membrane protein A and related proteins
MVTVSFFLFSFLFILSYRMKGGVAFPLSAKGWPAVSTSRFMKFSNTLSRFSFSSRKPKPNSLVFGVLSIGIVTLLTASLLSACGEPAATTSAAATNITVTSTSNANSNGKIAVILAGSSNDGGWSSLGFEGVVQLKRETGLTVDYFEKVTPDKEEATLRDLAGKGYGLIIAHGGQFAGNLKKVAPDFPKIWFLQIAGDATGPNLASVGIRFEDAAYLLGMGAAFSSSGTKFGYITGPKVPVTNAQSQGFEQGVLAVKPNATVEAVFLKSWQDGTAGTEAANALLDKGVEVIYYNFDPLDQPIMKAAQSRGKRVINQGYDLNYLAPDTVLSSLLVSGGALFTPTAKLWLEKKLEGKNYSLGLKEGALSLASFRGKLSKEAEAQLEKTRNDILAGTLKITLK